MSTPRQRPRSAQAAVTVRRPHAAAWRRAVRLAGGDTRRLEILSDGTVVVRNKPVR